MNQRFYSLDVFRGATVALMILVKGKTHEMVSGLFVAGCVLIFTGYCRDMVFPVNKKIWTSSFTVHTTGLALLILGVMIYIIEFKGWKGRLSRFFDVFGKNALFIYVMSGVLPRLLALIRIHGAIDADGRQRWLPPSVGSMSIYVNGPCQLNLRWALLYMRFVLSQ